MSEQKGTGGGIILSANAAKAKNRSENERVLLALKASVRTVANARNGWRPNNLGPAWQYKTKESVEKAKALEHEKLPATATHRAPKLFFCYSHRYAEHGGVQQEQYMSHRFGEPGDWRCVTHRAAPSGPWSYRPGPPAAEPPTPPRDPNYFQFNKRHQKMVPETGRSELGECLAWGGGAQGELPRPVGWQAPSAAWPARRGKRATPPALQTPQPQAGSPGAPSTVPAPAAGRATATSAWKARPSAVRQQRRDAAQRWAATSQLG
eukprot:TRINITY_DN61107_c0_g1_i1.p1 TRINITY_DN61107_c0_g1~~TRINITY_DN61107_c0_g1_i1.p1  ORF type:complete len:291 (+),score=72.21 TRINITY_DN61107_c0_g1_i1:84-875(+)